MPAAIRSARAWRAAFFLAAILLLTGAGWLAFAGGRSMTPVLDRAWTPSELAEARKALAGGGIDSRLESGRLLVPRSRLPEARQILQEEALRAGGESGDLERLAEKEDVWSSQSQIARRWQAAKMAAMARLIRRFPQVRSASVIFEEGTAGGLGAPGAEPTAVVAMELKVGSAMTGELVDAIADLVAGGVAGMKRQNVRIVEGSGRSYRAAEAALAESPAMRQIQAAEVYYTRKVRAAIPQMEGAIVSVRVEPQDPLPRCAEVRVSIPRGYFVAAARAGSGLKRPDEGAVQAAIAAGLDQVRDMVVWALGEKEAGRVKTDCYPDASEAVEEAAAAPMWPPQGPWTLWAGTAAAGALAGAVLWAMAARLLFRPKGGAAGAPSAAALAGVNSPKGVLGLLHWASVEDILSFLRDEHPQMAAVLLASLPADKAGAVLAALPGDVQREVSRRIAAMEQIEPQMLRDVDRAIASRLAELARGDRPAAGGPRKLADLLHKAGPQTRRHVLEDLSRDLPGLAESLRQTPLAFEDIASLGESRLGAVLEDMDSQRLAVALRTASKPLAQKVFASLSSPAARRLRAQMERVGPVRLSEVEAAQQQIVEELLGSPTATGPPTAMEGGRGPLNRGRGPLGAEPGQYAPASGEPVA